MIIRKVAKRNCSRLFDNTTTYLTKITQGNLHLKKYAQETQILYSHLHNVTMADKEKIRKLRRNLASITNATKSIIKIVKHANSLVSLLINLSEARWNPQNISINFTQTDITPKQLIDNLMNGLDVVPHAVGGLIKTGVDEIANITGSGIEHLLKPLLPLLIPVAIITFAVILFCGIFQLHPKCARNRERLMPSWSRESEKERKILIQDMMKPPQRRIPLKNGKKKGQVIKNF